MTSRLYDVTLGAADGRTRVVHVESPTDVQAGDAAASLMQGDEAILSIERAGSADAAPTDAGPPKSQAAELAPVTPGMAAAPEPGSGSVDAPQDVSTSPSPHSGRNAGFTQIPEADAPASAPPLSHDRPADIDGDPAELNRGLGQERVGEAGPAPLQRPLDPAAGGPGTGAGSSAALPSEDQPARTPS